MIGIFYGSSTGNTESLAKQIATKLGVETPDIHDVGRSSADKVAQYDCLLLGSSTWGLGELQDDWFDFAEKLKKMDLSGKKIALFGCGDSASYPDTFGDALGIIRDDLAGTGCVFVGQMDDEGYGSTDSRAFEGGKVIGLIADDNDPELTEKRLDLWAQAIKNA